MGLLVPTGLPALGFDVVGHLVDIVECSDEDDILSQVVVDARVLGAVDVEELYGDFDGGVRTWEEYLWGVDADAIQQHLQLPR